MNPKNMLAFRYIKSRKRNRLMSFLSITSVIGIMLGVATLIIVVNVMSGFMDNLKEKLLGINSDITITRYDNQQIADYDEMIANAKTVSGVRGVAPYTNNQVLLTSEQIVTGAIVKGIDPSLEGEVSKLPSFVTRGELDDLAKTVDGQPTIFLGRDLALTLNVFPGEVVTIVSPYGARGPFGMTPKMKKFVVAGFFDTGINEYNMTFAYISIPAAQSFFGLGDKVTGLSVSVDKGADPVKIKTALSEHLRYPNWARDWMSMNNSLFSALKLERFAMFIILTLIVIVASFNIISMISITVKDKQKDIAILRAYGASSSFITGVFIRQGLIVGLLGTLLGNLLALVISLVLRNFRIIDLPENIYFMDKIPIDMNIGVYLLVTLCAVVITFLASVFPAMQASKQPPIVALRNN